MWMKALQTGKVVLRSATPGDQALVRRGDAQPHVRASDLNGDGVWEIEHGKASSLNPIQPAVSQGIVALVPVL
jgi:hypothetical protein